jgi:D-3-phosphoglycerate dehydrogenase
MTRVLVTDELQPVGVEYLRGQGLDVDVAPTLPEAALCERLSGVHGLIVRSATRVTRAMIQAGTDLVVIGRAGAGVDNIDVEAATERGVIVMNTPGGNTIAVAEHTIALLLASARNIPQAHAALKAGRWEKNRFGGVEVFGKTLGLVGLGRIGAEVARRALGLSMKVIAYDPYLTREATERMGVEPVELDELFRRADVVSLHTPLSADTRNLVGERELALMKPTARIINCARGGVVSERALAAAIQAGQVAGAALDVFETEPLPAGHPLLGFEQVVATPHLAASTEEAQAAVALGIAEGVASALVRGVAVNAVNMPSADAETLRELAPHLTLAGKMGRFLAQLGDGRVVEVRLTYAGEIASRGTDALRVAFLKGLLDAILDERVTDVNAPLIARARGLRITETSTSESPNFTSSLGAALVRERGESSAEGVVFHRREPRLVRIDGFSIEAPLQGVMLVFSNLDVPGVIGRIGTLCGQNGLNIAGMQLGREHRGGRAISVVNLDDPVPEPVLAQIRAMPDIVFAKLVRV